MSEPRTAASLAGFALRALVLLAIGVAALLLWRLRNVLLLLFASVVLALLLSAAAQPLARGTPLSRRWAVAVTTLVLLAVLAGAVGFFGWSLQAQLFELVQRVPGAWAALQGRLQEMPFGPRLLDTVRQAAPDPSFGLLAKVRPYLTGAAGGAGNLLLVLAAGIYLALDPGLYRKGLALLLPKQARPTAFDTLDAMGKTLQSWLLAQGLGMLVVGILTGAGLWFIGVPAAGALGLLAGLADFVPLVGPLIAGALSLLLAVPLGLDHVGWTLALFVGVQQIEGNVLLPVLQRRIVSLPPVLTLFSLVSFGVVFGFLGVLLAVPLTAALLVAVRRLYLHKVLGEQVEA